MRHRSSLQLAALALSALATPCLGQAPGGRGIVYGPHHVFIVEAPPGWVLDNQVGRSRGLVAVFYREGQSWRTGDAVMYVNTAVPDSGTTADPFRVIADDSLRFTKDAPGVRIGLAPSLRTKDGRVAHVRHFSGDPNGNWEAVAYIAEATVTPLLVLTARTRVAFEEALPAFARLVQSYTFLTADDSSAQHSDFLQNLASYQEDIATPGGLAYEHQFTLRYQASYGAVLGACIQRTGQPPSSFEVVFVIDKDGRVTSGVPKAPSPLVACVIEAAQKDTFPKPPVAPFHQHLVQSFDP